MLSTINRTLSDYAAPEQLRAMGLGDADLSASSAVYYVAYSLFCLPSLWLAKRISMRLFMAWSLVAWGALTMFTASAGTRGQLICARFATGAIDAAFLPIVYAYLDLYFQPVDASEVRYESLCAALFYPSLPTSPAA